MSFLLIFLVVFNISICSGLNILSSISKISSEPIAKLLDSGPDFIGIAYEDGYIAERHEVTTEDGYILTVHRIPPRSNCTSKIPVLMVHGAFLTSEVFLAGGIEAPAYLFANECYDVWFGNVRGNFHSRRHVYLNPDKDQEFWKYSYHEMGLYDTPAMVDLVLNTTKSEKLIYVGYSQGGNCFFAMNSERPEYAAKISLFVGLAPGSRLIHTRSATFRGASITINTFKDFLEASGVSEILSKGFPIQGVLGTVCQVEALAGIICGTTTAILDSPNPDSVTADTQKRLYQFLPGGTSVQTLAHYGQNMKNPKFTKFDYGPEKNIKVYGCSEPPEYNLKAVTSPVVIFQGLEDHFVDFKDTEWLVSQLPNVLDFIKVKDPLWNHIDVICSRYWKDTIFVPLKKYLAKYDCYNGD